MNFKKCTDDLLIRITLDDVAKALDLSVQTIRQARVSSASSAYRTPPNGWESAVRILAERRVKELKKLIKRL